LVGTTLRTAESSSSRSDRRLSPDEGEGLSVPDEGDGASGAGAAGEAALVASALDDGAAVVVLSVGIDVVSDTFSVLQGEP
jgi:hypothetical protein